MSTKLMVTGFASFMEDEDIPKNTPPDITEVDTISSTQTEIDNTTAMDDLNSEIQEESTETEMMLQRFEKYGLLYKHIKRYGVSQSFLALHDSDGSLSRDLQLRFPAMESISMKGDPYDPVSIACQEGIKDFLGEIWNFIKVICRKITKFFARIAEAVMVNFRSLDENIGRLRKALKNKRQDDKAMEKYEGHFVPEDKLNEYWKEIINKEKAVANEGIENALQIVTNMLMGQARNLVENKETTSNAEKYTDDRLKEASEKLTEAEKKISKDKDTYKLPSRPSASTQHITGNPVGILDQVAPMKGELDKNSAKMKILNNIAKQLASLADKGERRDDGGAKGQAATARKMTGVLNRYSAMMSKFVNEKLWVLNRKVRIVSIYVVNCMVGDSEALDATDK